MEELKRLSKKRLPGMFPTALQSLTEAYTVIPRLTKIIRSGITFVSRNLHYPKRDVIRRLTSRCLERKQPSQVGGSPLCDVVSSFICHTYRQKR